ncbi:hypothetical protein [Coleofasciculus chthonoplastes]|nr:hypothetical protein [Coleofasciculus chthonoplastes]
MSIKHSSAMNQAQAFIRINLSQNPCQFWFTAIQWKHSLNRGIF